MLKRLSPAEQIGVLLDQYSLAVRDAFLVAIADVRSRITLQLVVDRLIQQDIEGAVRALHIEAPAFNPVLDEIAKAFTGGGNSTIESLPSMRSPEGHKLVLRWDVRDPVAERWLRDHSAQFMTNLVSDQADAVRQTMAAGLAQMQHPRAIALDIVGRKNRITGQREGGIIGLTSVQSGYSRNYRAELEAADPAALDRTLRDRRSDKSVRAAIAEGKPLPAAAVSRLVTSYEASMLRVRGETISRTETVAALGASSEEAMRQNVAKGYIPAELVTKVWNAISDGRTRHSHYVLNGQAIGLDESFVSPLGNRMKYPGDTSMGAGTADLINCRCNATYRIEKTPRLIH